MKSFTLHDLPKEERPRERLVKFGEQALSTQELLQLLLGRGIAGESVTVTAQKILSHFGNLNKISEASIEELSSIKGIGLAKAAQLKATFEIGRRMSSHVTSYTSKDLTSPEKVFKVIRNRLKTHKKEHFYSIPINSRGWMVSEVSIGSLDSAIVHPREVFSDAIRVKASSIIFAHNHPSGDPTPSDADIEMTYRLREAGNILGINLIDHIIVTENSYLSLRKEGII